MKLWDSIRNEVSGMMRSLRYDMKTNNSHAPHDPIYPEYDAYATRRPRRFLATTGITAVALGGMTAVYFVLTASLGGLMHNSSATDGVPSNPFPTVTTSDSTNVVSPPARGSGGAPQPAPAPDPVASSPSTAGGPRPPAGNGGAGARTPAGTQTTGPTHPAGTGGSSSVPSPTNQVTSTAPGLPSPTGPTLGRSATTSGDGELAVSVTASPTQPIMSTARAIAA